MLKKFISMLLVILMTAPTFLSCSEKIDDESETNPPESTVEVSENAEAEDSADEDSADENSAAEQFEADDLDDSLDFGGQTISVLYWSDVENLEFHTDEFNGEIVHDSIHQRNINVEDDLGIKYNWIGTPGDGSYINDYVTKVRESHTAGDNAYDIYAAYSRTVMGCVLNGFTTNLENTAYLNFDKPWWPYKLLQESTINNHLYMVSGDISTNMLHMMYCIYYNRDLIADYQLPLPTDLVFENKWTLDTLVSLTNDVYRDKNGNSEKDAEDVFGFTLVEFHNDAFYTGSDLKLVERDPDSILVISPDFFSEKSLSIIEKLGPWENSNDVYLNGDYEVPFTEGRALFTVNRAHYAAKALRESELNYGIVPIPKYDENQENYNTVMGNPVTLYSISIGTPNKEVCSAVLECMASNAYRLTTPAIFENNMKAKYSADDINAQMYDIVRETVSFELGRFMNKQLNNITDIFYLALVENDTNWGSKSKALSKPLTKMLDKVVKSILENEEHLE